MRILTGQAAIAVGIRLPLASAAAVHYHATRGSTRGRRRPRDESAPMARRLMACLFAMLCAIASAHAQTGFDRPGGDYFNFNVASDDPAPCAAPGQREGRCRAWRFSYPAPAAPGGACRLKSRVTTRVEDSCCVSGVKGAGVLERKSGPIEFSIDRTGGGHIGSASW